MTRPPKTRICIPVGAGSFDELARLVDRASETADIIELRLDYLDEAEIGTLFPRLERLVNTSRLPLLLTYRPENEGGRSRASFEDRCEFWKQLASLLSRSSGHFVDLELSLLELCPELRQNRFGQLSLICSQHDFERVPPNIDETFKRMLGTSASIVKAAFHANDVTDCISFFKLVDSARNARREIIALAMGEAGILTRVLGPSRGTFLTFGSLEDELATAPGQISARELRDLYRIDNINEQTQVTGIIGLPVTHSVSPQMHNRAFAACNIDAVYLPFAVSDLEAFVRRMVRTSSRELNWNIRGFSVTAPHKQSIMKYLEWLDPIAREIGAVNTVVVEGEELHGYNTDAAAVLAALNGSPSLEGARVAVIGAGGAARALLWSLRAVRAHTTVFARNAAKAENVAAEFGAEFLLLPEARFEGYDVVINTTPLGTSGKTEAETPATSTQLRGARTAYDLVYNPAETRFMAEGVAAGCAVFGGLPMLVAQAADQFRLWSGMSAPVDVMRRAAEDALIGNGSTVADSRR